MRISDWSSDVCSSDLGGAQPRPESGPDNRWRSFSPSFGGQIGAVAGGGIGTHIEQRAKGLRCSATTFPISRYLSSSPIVAKPPRPSRRPRPLSDTPPRTGSRLTQRPPPPHNKTPTVAPTP